MSKAERRAKYTKLARDQAVKRRHREEQRKLVCYLCRQRGHGVDSCPQRVNVHDNNKKAMVQKPSAAKKCCYKCGSLDHGLATCPLIRNKQEDNGELPYAICFVCNKQGHLASQCPENDKGIYVNGGACKTCGSKFHLSNQCPKKQTANRTQNNDNDKGLPVLGKDVLEDLVEDKSDARQVGGSLGRNKSERATKPNKNLSKKRVVNF